MVRFCDREVVCLEQGSVSYSELLQYFLNGHIDDPVCVMDDSGMYFGYITYHSLLQNTDISSAIHQECLVLEKDIWKTARMAFALYARAAWEYPLLPVVDQNRQLFCFAYEDTDANRELRMLWELQENPNALQFGDIYPECQCVRIYDFNELAYFFAKYLEKQGIPVQVEGSMWKGFFSSHQGEFLDYDYIDVYAEGILPKPANWMENLLRSVSVEFECVDHIYEENIKDGRIKDADVALGDLSSYLRKSGGVVILGTDVEAQDAYDYLRKEGIEVYCFVERVCKKRNLFGKSVLTLEEAMEKYGEAVFVENRNKGSAWGMGMTDYFSYLGYKRNRDFFLLKDYFQIPSDGLKSALKDQKIVLVGDFLLCEKLAEYFERNQIFGGKGNRPRYISLPDDTLVGESRRLEVIDVEVIRADDLCLIAVPKCFSFDQGEKVKNMEEKSVSYLVTHGAVNYTNYFSHMISFVNIEKETECKYHIDFLKPKRILLGSINGQSGNVFFRGLLDNHPSIMMMDYSYFNNDLFWYCIRLSGKKTDDLVSLFLKLIDMEWEGKQLVDVNLFMEKMIQLLDRKKGQEHTHTSQELFVIFHIAYLYMYGIDINSPENMVIYWEPHHVPRNILEDCVQWFGEEVECDIINVVRNWCMRNGSNIKGILDEDWEGAERGSLCHIAIAVDDSEKKDYSNSRRFIVRFEDLKCRPREELRRLCGEWEIPWSESLMHVTIHGKEWLYGSGEKKVKDFDLTPVYNLYEEYFSEFDRFKITLICAPWQKRYGYPYVDASLFSRRELQEMFLQEFRFMDRLQFNTGRVKLIFNLRFQNFVRERIQRLKMLSANI